MHLNEVDLHSFLINLIFDSNIQHNIEGDKVRDKRFREKPSDLNCWKFNNTRNHTRIYFYSSFIYKYFISRLSV